MAQRGFGIRALYVLACFLASFSRIADCQASFSSGQTIVSASASAFVSNGSFSLGFKNSDSDRGEFEFGIWYNVDPARFLVWSAAGGTSRFSSSAVAQLTSDGDLVVIASSTNRTVLWSSGTASKGATSGLLQSSGNLVLHNATADVIWSSFDNPTTTLLPNQSLKNSLANLTSGSYTLAMESSGNLTLRYRGPATAISVPYWSSGTAQSNPKPVIATFSSTGVFYLYANASTSSLVKQFFGRDSADSPLRRLSLESDGNLRMYSWLSGAWSPQWQAVTDQCNVFGYCGIYGICSHRAVPRGGSTVSCGCPQGLRFIDPADRRGGCTGTGDVARCDVTLVQSNSSAWLDDGSGSSVQGSQEQCKSTCLNDQSCVACMSRNDGSGDCVQIRSRFLSGYTSPSLQSAAFLKVCTSAANSPPTESEPDDDRRSSSSSAAAPVGIAVAVTLAAVGLGEALIAWAVIRRRRRSAAKSAARDAILDYASGAPIRFSYKELQNATYNFSNKIGEGGFGAVYKGFLGLPAAAGNKKNSAIAVKKLEGVFQGEKEFRTEVAAIGGTHHMNLMHLVGFCSEGTHTRLLVYQFMPNGSLDSFLFHHDHDRADRQQILSSSMTISISEDSAAEEQHEEHKLLQQQQKSLLDWKTRFKIAVGTARGLAYLHEECREPIVHCDLKPENILLDDDFSPRISDFGLARFLVQETRSLNTTIRGTRGYLAPEWLANKPITPKSDVYSYGMILLELVGGRRNIDTCSQVPRGRQRYPAWAFRELQAGQVYEVGDETMGSLGPDDVVQLERVVKVAFWCIQESANSRPSMSKVVQMLEGDLAVLPPPMPKSVAAGETAAAASSSSSPSSSSLPSSFATTTTTTSSSSPVSSVASQAGIPVDQKQRQKLQNQQQQQQQQKQKQKQNQIQQSEVEGVSEEMLQPR